MLRRNFPLFVGSGLIGLADICQAQGGPDAGDQGDYLFWMDGDSRASAKAAAEAMVHSLEFDGENLLLAARALYLNADKAIRERFTIDGFADRLAEHRRIAGGIAKRSMQGIEGGFLTLPNLPNGRYCIVIFDLLSVNARQLILTEQITLSLSPGFDWRVAGYYLGEKPYYRV